MKETQENVAILKKLGFISDYDNYPNKKNPIGKRGDYRGWYSLKDGWTFNISSMPSFKNLISRLRETAKEDGIDEGIDQGEVMNRKKAKEE